MKAMERTRNLLMVVPVAEGTLIPEGIMIGINAEGYAVPASKSSELKVAGVSVNYADNQLGDPGAISIEVKRGAFTLKNDGTIKETDLLKNSYIFDKETVTLTAEGSSVVGKILQVEENGITVEIM